MAVGDAISFGDGTFRVSTTGAVTAASLTTSGALAPATGLDLTGLTTGAAVVSLTDNLASALDFKEGSNSYMKFVTTNSSESVTFAKVITASGGVTGNLTGNVTGNTSGTAGGLLAAAVFTSTEQTGTGSSQDIAHGFGAVPKLVSWSVSDSGATGIYTAVPGAHDATNAKITVTSGVKFYIHAWK